MIFFNIEDILTNPIIQNIIAALIGSALTFIFLKALIYIRDYFYAKKFYFGGSWNTVYEDNEGILRVKKYAHAILLQSGKKVSGYTTFGEGDHIRKWDLHGEIIADRFLSGTYSIKSRHGEFSIGSFFLEKSGTGQELIGYWCGYDPMLGDVNSGKYVFYRKANPMLQVNIRPAFKADTVKIRELGDKIFGVGYLDNWSLPDPNTKQIDDSICLVATKGASIVGMIYFCIMHADFLYQLEKNGFDVSGLNKRMKKVDEAHCAFLSVIMVDEKYRRRGIGTTLYAKSFQILSEINISCMYVTCWKESPNSGIIPFLTKQGWSRVAEKEKYWYQDSIDKRYKCSRCGNPCFCTATLMKIDILNQISDNKI